MNGVKVFSKEIIPDIIFNLKKAKSSSEIRYYYETFNKKKIYMDFYKDIPSRRYKYMIKSLVYDTIQLNGRDLVTERNEFNRLEQIEEFLIKSLSYKKPEPELDDKVYSYLEEINIWNGWYVLGDSYYNIEISRLYKNYKLWYYSINKNKRLKALLFENKQNLLLFLKLKMKEEKIKKEKEWEEEYNIFLKNSKKLIV